MDKAYRPVLRVLHQALIDAMVAIDTGASGAPEERELFQALSLAVVECWKLLRGIDTEAQK